MTTHKLKTLPKFFIMTREGFKTFELRENDRDYSIGDELLLEEYDALNKTYTGRILHRQIVYILNGGEYGLLNGYVILGIDKI